MLTGSEHLSASMARGQTSLHGEIEKTHSALVRTCTALVIWSNGSSTRSSSAGVWRPATTNSQPTTSHSSSLPQYGYGYVLMSTGPSQIASNLSAYFSNFSPNYAGREMRVTIRGHNPLLEIELGCVMCLRCAMQT